MSRAHAVGSNNRISSGAYRTTTCCFVNGLKTELNLTEISLRHCLTVLGQAMLFGRKEDVHRHEKGIDKCLVY
jgi:hypothetical protein